jgi:hypothetical protein
MRYEGVRTRGGSGKGGGGSRSTGFIIWLEYAPQDFTPADATVEVGTPDGQHVLATFDLSSLR